MSLIDKRYTDQNADAGNRKKFLDRCKDNLSKALKHILNRGSITDAGKDDIFIKDETSSLDEYSFTHDPDTGTGKYVFANNHEYNVGEQIYLNRRGAAKAKAGGQDGDGLREFAYQLRRKEFLDILFEDMALPNYVKESLAGDVKYRLRRGGVCPQGPITKLNILKTFAVAMGRKFAAKDAEKKPPFLTAEDLRFNVYVKRPIPIHQAVMICLEDASGSMSQEKQALAKRFFTLLYLFLERNYEAVECRFVGHDTEAWEWTEEEFFDHDGEGGGTSVIAGYEYVRKIISEYDASKVNVYVAYASDGDVFESASEVTAYLKEHIVPVTQYLAYLQVADTTMDDFFRSISIKPEALKPRGLYPMLKQVQKEFPNKVGVGYAVRMDQIFSVLSRLFKKGQNE